MYIFPGDRCFFHRSLLPSLLYTTFFLSGAISLTVTHYHDHRRFHCHKQDLGSHHRCHFHCQYHRDYHHPDYHNCCHHHSSCLIVVVVIVVITVIIAIFVIIVSATVVIMCAMNGHAGTLSSLMKNLQILR